MKAKRHEGAASSRNDEIDEKKMELQHELRNYDVCIYNSDVTSDTRENSTVSDDNQHLRASDLVTVVLVKPKTVSYPPSNFEIDAMVILLSRWLTFWRY